MSNIVFLPLFLLTFSLVRVNQPKENTVRSYFILNPVMRCVFTTTNLVKEINKSQCFRGEISKSNSQLSNRMLFFVF